MSNSLTPVSDYAIVKAGTAESVRVIIQQNIGTSGINWSDLDRVTVPTGGGLTWSIPTLVDTEQRATIEGVIIAFRDSRVFWRGDYSGAGDPPDCASDDGIIGQGDPGGYCASCPHAQWGSGRGRGQMCRLLRLLFVVPPDAMLPLVIALPPTSVKPCRKYMQRLTAKCLPHTAVITTIGLERALSGDGIAYSRATFSVGSELDEETAATFAGIRDTIAGAVRGAALNAQDYAPQRDIDQRRSATDEHDPASVPF